MYAQLVNIHTSLQNWPTFHPVHGTLYWGGRLFVCVCVHFCEKKACVLTGHCLATQMDLMSRKTAIYIRQSKRELYRDGVSSSAKVAPANANRTNAGIYLVDWYQPLNPFRSQYLVSAVFWLVRVCSIDEHIIECIRQNFVLTTANCKSCAIYAGTQSLM